MNLQFKNIFSCIVLLIIMIPFSYAQETSAEHQKYVEEIKAFHQKRIDNLKKENGWLNLVGLFLLQEGKNSFGSNKKNNLIFPKGKCPEFIGNITLKNNIVTIEIKKGIIVWNDDKKVTKQLIYKNEDENPIVLKYKSLRWFVIKRGDDFYIRLRDLESENLQSFHDINTYPIDEQWKVEAILDTTTKNKIEVTDVLGHINNEESAGTLVFTIDGKEYRLDALDEGDNLFVIFADKTNETATYFTGRFLNVKKADENGRVYLDFNKAINPPCAFTDFATCPLPPKQNMLPISITAGEKRYGKH